MVTTFSRKFGFRREKYLTITDYTGRVIATLQCAIGLVFDIDTTVACQSSYMKVFASGGNFQDVCGELIGGGSGPPCLEPSVYL